jgi:ATP-dependent RNA helicase RhlE
VTSRLRRGAGKYTHILMSFSSFDLDPRLHRGVADLGFTDPTPIQRDAIPPALEGRDVLACAMTGSGKTAAFALPILQRLLGKPRGTTKALVLAPTRELAAQIVEHFNDIARHTPIRAAAVYGGVGMGPQEQALRKGVDVIVACPGRLLDHFQYPYARLAGLEVLVLDEADRMLDMGFLPDIRRVLRHLPPADQTLFFSATVPPPIRELARQMLKNPVSLNIERASAPATGIEQAIYPVRQDVKSSLLLELLKGNTIENAIVFTRTKHRANRLAQFLERHGVSCDKVHGNRSQPQRTQALADFKSGRVRVLVATDIAARGIDVEGLSHVVNFDVPNVPEDYIHRVGRTARAGATGDAITFVSPEEMNELRAIERAVAKVLPKKTLDGFDYQPKTAEKLEIPLAERLAAMRAQRSGDRARSAAKADRKPQPRNSQPSQQRPASRTESHPRPAAPAPRPQQAARPQEGHRPQESHRRGAAEATTINPWPGRLTGRTAATPEQRRRRLR